MIKQHCSICDGNNWQYMDELRDWEYWYQRDYREKGEPVGFKICKDCGYVSYDYLEPERLQAIYNQQRPVMMNGNIITSNRKNMYHHAFLNKFLFDNAISSWNVLDVGCAQGAFLNYLKENHCLKNVYGTEWADSYLAFAKNEYGIIPSNEIDTTRKYDFISYYHVLEHIQWPDKELEKAKSVLNDGGYLYLSVPLWFDILDESAGNATVDFENYYHINHVNVFSMKSFRNLLTKCGLEVILEDTQMYCYTVICKVSDTTGAGIEREDWKAIRTRIEAEKRAMEHLNKKEFDEAIKAVPKYPDAYIFKSISKDTMKDFDAQNKVIGDALKLMPDYYKLLLQLAKLNFQWDENGPNKQKYYGNRIKLAESILNQVEAMKPGQDETYYILGLIEWRYKQNYDKAVELLKKCIAINPMKFGEVWDLIAAIWKDKG